MSSAIKLRPYQTELKNRIYNAIKEGKKEVLAVLPTGGGKTFTMGSIALDCLQKQRGVLILVHRDNLVSQTVSSLSIIGVKKVGVIKSGWPSPSHRDRIIVASLQSLTRRDYPNLGPKVCLIVDEAHTLAFYESLGQIRSHYRTTADVIELGFTATPWRLNKREYMGMHYGFAVSRTATIRTLQELNQIDDCQGLTKTIYKGWGGIKNFDAIHLVGGEFDRDEVDKLTLDYEWLSECADKITSEIGARPTAVFCASVNQSRMLSDILTAGGKTTAIITADTPVTERTKLYSDFEQGIIQILIGVGCFLEGWDCPRCSCVVLAMPTNSIARYVQAVGRGIRAFPGKCACLILDFCGNFDRHGSVEDISERPVELFPELKDPEGVPTKECPSCGNEIPVFANPCPYCGHIFPKKEQQRKPRDPKEWGLKLDPATKRELSKLRRERYQLYKKGEDPQKILIGFNQELSIDYLYACCFRPPVDQSDFLRFRDYLLKFSSNKDFLEWHLSAEFGSGRYNPILGQVVEPYRPPILEWWQILSCDPFAAPAQVLEAYQVSLLNSYRDGDNDRIKLITYALERSNDQGFPDTQMRLKGVKMGVEDAAA